MNQVKLSAKVLFLTQAAFRTYARKSNRLDSRSGALFACVISFQTGLDLFIYMNLIKRTDKPKYMSFSTWSTAAYIIARQLVPTNSV